MRTREEWLRPEDDMTCPCMCPECGAADVGRPGEDTCAHCGQYLVEEIIPDGDAIEWLLAPLRKETI